ncbi:MAG TPA: HD domain-containing phosphohydrolase [Longimicrobiales bacterium]|nr:HD domain-containing phosphohydrolase [Longimicrobiales bacterium]
MSETNRTVLVVDDDPEFRFLHRELLKGFGYAVESASDGVEALALMRPGIDLVVMDAQMPNLDGFQVAEMIRQDESVADVPIMMVTGLEDREVRLRAFDLGINDFINKPVDPSELRLRARWLVSLKVAQDEIRAHGRMLEERVRLRTRELQEALEEVREARLKTHQAHLDTIRRLTIAGEYKDRATADHVERIGRFSAVLARAMELPDEQVGIIRHAAPMHDVGKLGIPDRILLKPGSLTEEEWVIMRSHTLIGAKILRDSASEVIQMGEQIALSHHEWWDGNGYPQGLAGTEIPLEARICAVVDVFDALSVARPYRGALPHDRVIRMMAAGSGTHFDPRVLDVFMEVQGEISLVQADYAPEVPKRALQP